MSSHTLTSGARAPAGAALHELFEAVARSGPDRPALLVGEETVSYRGLDDRADRVATALHAAGVRQGGVVGVHMVRSADLYAVMLAVLKLGASVVPLNPDHPAAFVDRVVAEAAPDLVLCDDPAAWAGRGVRAESVADLPAVPADTATPRAFVEPEDTAFVMFTSGSTGRPKGVRIAHRGLARLAEGQGDLAVSEVDCLVQLAPFSFAASTIEIWLSLLHGARLVVLPPGLPSLPALRRVVEQYGVTVLSLPAGLFGLLVDNEPDCLRTLRVILISGDFAEPGQLARAAGITDATLFNGYGCTENSSITALHPITDPADVTGSRVPIGKPLPGVELHVLDRDLRPCLPGETGELCVGGTGVALGYLGLPELTREKFVTAEADGGVLYRTGDLARRTDDGDVTLVGRADSMVKVRGFRVETAEVELALRGLDGVAAAAVKAFDSGDGTAHHLVGFYTAEDDAGALDPAEVATRLGDLIPHYAVPETLVPMDRIPVNVNGKIDRAALTDPSAGDDPRGATMSEQSNPLEPVILRMWKDICGNDEFTAQDPFLGHGGNSLHFVQLAANLQRVFAIEIDTEDVFRHGTVEQLAEYVDRARSEPATR